MITSKLTGRARTTIPQAVRTALNIKQGDKIVYSISGGRVILSKAAEVPTAMPTTFDEWASEYDRLAYAGL